jgi:predicted dehydrogenase
MKNIWIIGAGNIAQEYSKILKSLGYGFTVIGRGEEKAKMFKEATGHDVIIGGLEKYISTRPEIPEYAIVAVNLGSLSSTCITLMNYGVKKILCEKPGFLYPSECAEVLKVAKDTGSNVYLAYNRRFYSSVLKAEEIINEDGGVKSFNFEFTEWGHVIEKLNKPQGDLDNWFYANSSHVVDLAFFLGGKPAQMSSFTAGEISWHKPAVFAGAGVTDKGALFNYTANWAAPGRWGVEILTSKHRLYLRPMEQLQIQNIGSVAISSVNIDDHLDKEYKPGFYLETKAFIENNTSRLCTVQQQLEHIENIYRRIIRL